MLALVLATSMVMGSSIVSFAANTGNGTVSGNGVSEGHVDKKVLNVVLPTVAEGDSAFQYTMDPERLIQATAGAKYEDFTFPAEEADAGVYFLVGDKTFANTSTEYQIINKSSCNVELTVKAEVEATAGGTDITLDSNGKNSVSANTIDPKLYLGLKVGSDEQGVPSTGDTTITKILAGKPDNFTVAVKDGEYVYEPKAEITPWKAMSVSMTGEASKCDIDSTTTAPKVIVTWSWQEDTSGQSAATDAVDAVEGPQVIMNKNGTIRITKLEGSLFQSLTMTIGDESWPLTSKSGTWEWEIPESGNKVFTLGSGWYPNFVSGKTAIATVTLKDGTTIKSAPVTFD